MLLKSSKGVWETLNVERWVIWNFSYGGPGGLNQEVIFQHRPKKNKRSHPVN